MTRKARHLMGVLSVLVFLIVAGSYATAGTVNITKPLPLTAHAVNGMYVFRATIEPAGQIVSILWTTTYGNGMYAPDDAPEVIYPTLFMLGPSREPR